MVYIQVRLQYNPLEVDSETLAVWLTSLDFDSFEELPEGMLAYIPEEHWDREILLSRLPEVFEGVITLAGDEPLIEKNWNEVWESNFPAVEIAGTCRVRAPFHEPDPAFPLELIIEPKMSFGTAHHETTALMIELMLPMRWKEKKVLDMGCGTGILAIAAAKMGAPFVMAVDNDSWAYENTLENIARNGVDKAIEVKLGDASTPSGDFDVVIANINRNILLQDIPAYAAVMKSKAVLMLSGFYDTDLEVISQKAAECGLLYSHHLEKNQWVAAVFKSESAGEDDA
jgi:ribosomal protein L11 methyltransferase